jgi:hypothetical protein
MDLPDYKQLKKLADACRKAGIKTFKGFGMEFTLTDEAPVSNYKQTKKSDSPATKPFYTDVDSKIESDSLSDEALLFWSAQGAPDQQEDGAES